MFKALIPLELYLCRTGRMELVLFLFFFPDSYPVFPNPHLLKHLSFGHREICHYHKVNPYMDSVPFGMCLFFCPLVRSCALVLI